ncbi:hypothetical protein V8C40DRAFT_183960 [Trichoderma camerunense]
MAALGIRLLGLATARRAMRRWFRRGWPLGDSSDEEDDGQAVPPAPPNTPADTSLVSETDDDKDKKDPQPEEPEEPEEPEDEDSEPYIDDSEYDQDFYNDSSTMSLNMFVPTVSGMQQAVAAQAVAAPANAQENEEPQQLPDANPKEIEQPQQLSDAKVDGLTEQISKLNVARIDEPVVAVTKPLSTPGDDDATIAALTDPAVLAERAVHLKFIGEALDMAKLALVTNETPVGCVIVHDGKVIARGMNATNVTRNGTRHAEFMAIAALMSIAKPGQPKTTSLKPNVPPKKVVKGDGQSDISSVEWRSPDEGNEDGRKGHLYPYGQKDYPEERVDGSILHESTLYVTVEPCVMCASLLRQVGIKKVYFGAVNDKFGGTGGVFSIHANSVPVSKDGQTVSAHPQPKPIQYPDGGGSLGTSFPPGGGDGGNIEPGFEIEGGWGRDEAVALLRRFYVQENGRAPVPRKKEGRAARLAAMMEADGTAPPSTDAAAKEVKAANDAKDVNQDVKDVKDVKDVQPAEGGNDATKENVEPRNTQLLNKGEEPLAKETTV